MDTNVQLNNEKDFLYEQSSPTTADCYQDVSVRQTGRHVTRQKNRHNSCNAYSCLETYLVSWSVSQKKPSKALSIRIEDLRVSVFTIILLYIYSISGLHMLTLCVYIQIRTILCSSVSPTFVHLELHRSNRSFISDKIYTITGEPVRGIADLRSLDKRTCESLLLWVAFSAAEASSFGRMCVVGKQYLGELQVAWKKFKNTGPKSSNQFKDVVHVFLTNSWSTCLGGNSMNMLKLRSVARYSVES
jgi:hypothetical protein